MEVAAVALAVGLILYLAHRLRRKRQHQPRPFDEGFGFAMDALRRAEGRDDDGLSG